MDLSLTIDAPLAPRRRRARSLFAFGTSVAFLGAAAFHLLLLAAPWFWIGEILQDLRWHLGLASLAVALALLVARRPRRGALALLLAAFDLAPEARLYLPAAPIEAGAPRLVLATANVLFSNAERERLADALRASDAEVLALQELTPPLRSFLEQSLTALPHRAYSPEGTWPEGGAGLGLYSRTPLRDVRSLGLEVSYAPGLEATLDTAVGTVRIRVVHLQRPGKPWRLEQRSRGLGDLELLPWTERDLLVGDLNMTPSSPRFDRLLDRTELADSLSGHGRQPSYWKYPRLPRTLGVPIDHVLFGSAFGVAERRVFELPGSDHAGVRVELAPAPLGR
jgi:endonuclease/exonuclease/phosphatase family metal-dependent hydrolase